MKRWTNDEIAFLKANYLTMSYEEIANHLGRSERAVRGKCSELGLVKRKPWTNEEDDLLRELYSKFPETTFLDSLAKQLGRSRAAIACRANELGLTDQHRSKSLEHVRKMTRSLGRIMSTKNGLGHPTYSGRRADLGIYVRSRWEANYARYLNWLKSRGEIRDWSYEPDTFEFPVKRGTRFYTPDFKVTLNSGEIEYHEVKGYMDQKSRTALNRMARYYPHIKVIVVDRDAYLEIRRKLGRVIPNWEDAPPEPAWSEDDERMLVALWEAGVSKHEIAKRLGKTPEAVAVKAQRLGARRPARNVGNWFKQGQKRESDRHGIGGGSKRSGAGRGAAG